MAQKPDEVQLVRVMDPVVEAELRRALDGYTKRITALVGDQGVAITTLQAAVMLAIAQSPGLAKCELPSLILAVLQGCSEGITSFSGPYAGGWLVPFKGKVTLIHNYKCLIDVALESGAIQGINWGVVRDNDSFEYEDGLEPRLIHRKYLKGDRGSIYAAWAILTLPSGQKRIDVLDLDYLSQVRDSIVEKIDENKRASSPWVMWPEEMTAKTVIRHALKTCGLNFRRHERIVNILENDDRAVVGQVAKQFDGLPIHADATQSAREIANRLPPGQETDRLAEVRESLAQARTIDEVDLIEFGAREIPEAKALCDERRAKLTK